MKYTVSLKHNRTKAWLWAYEKWDYTGSTYGFSNEEHASWFLLRWA